MERDDCRWQSQPASSSDRLCCPSFLLECREDVHPQRILADSDTLVGNVEFKDSPLNRSADGFEQLKDKYLKLLLTIGITSNLDKHIVKSFSFELLEGISLPSEFELILISTSSEEERINLLNRIFDKMLTNKFIKSLTKKEKV